MMDRNEDEMIKQMADKVIEDKKAMGKRIEVARLNLALNQSELSRLVGVSAQAVQQWERGSTSPRGKNLTKISNNLQQSPQYLQFGDPAEAPSTTDGPRDTGTFVQSKAFAKVYRDSVVELISAGCDLTWLDCKNKTNINALVDIGLMKLRSNKTLSR
ncbi:MAG: transcriptional regulator with XRE-family HTH domain [Phenylobacterium sp.]|jgi:transcriptional regulator with XRE-family HTH domain